MSAAVRAAYDHRLRKVVCESGTRRLAVTDLPPQSNDAHGAIRVLPQAIDQMKQFLQPNGMVVNTCGGGKCVYPDPLSKGG